MVAIRLKNLSSQIVTKFCLNPDSSMITRGDDMALPCGGVERQIGGGEGLSRLLED